VPASGAALSRLVDATVIWGGGMGMVPDWAHYGGLQGTAFCTLQAAAGGDRVSFGMDRDPSVLRETDRCSGCFLGSWCERHQLMCIRGVFGLPRRLCGL